MVRRALKLLISWWVTTVVFCIIIWFCRKQFDKHHSSKYNNWPHTRKLWKFGLQKWELNTQNFSCIISDHTLLYITGNLDLHTHTPPAMFIHFLNTLLILFDTYMWTNTGIHRLFVIGNTTKCKCNFNFTANVSCHISNLELQSTVHELMLIRDIVLTCSARHAYERCALWSFVNSEELATFSQAQHKETVLMNDMMFVS